MNDETIQTDGCSPSVSLNDGRKGRKRPSLKILAAVVVIMMLMLCALHLNGWSVDFTDRDIRLIVTDSMDGEHTDYDIPTIEKDSVVMVRLIDDDEKPSLKEGDVIQFRQKGILNHHRLVSNDPGNKRIVTKGDNSPVSETVSYDDVLGVVVGKDHILGKAVSVGKANIVSVAILAAAAVAVTEIWSWYRRKTDAADAGTSPESESTCRAGSPDQIGEEGGPGKE
ncbi:MAG: S26 family signal peptidase [Thermoplasmata archaeon]|nr:S26 family signal peptidase [Thermoplasmata archaeon]